MTMTESPPDAEVDAVAPAPGAVSGLYDWLSTSDHRKIGRIWTATALVLLVATAAVGVALGIERVDANGIDVFGGVNSYFQMWALYRFALVLLVAAPLFVGPAIVIVPMQVGAANLAFPRAAAAAAWGYILGAGIVIVSVLAGGGWGALDAVSGDEADAIGLTLLGTAMVIVSLLVAAMCISTTVLSLRTRGMNLARVPLFAWSMLVAGVVWLLTLPVAVANIALAYADLHGGALEFGFPEGPDPVIFRQLEWLVLQPQVYAFAIPVLGVIGSVMPVAAGVRQVAHPAMMAMVGLFGLLALGGWSQPYFADTTTDFVFVAFGLVAMPAVFGAMGGAIATLAQGRFTVALPPVHLLGALCGGILLVAGVVAGALRVVEPFELAGTTAHTGILNLVAFAAVTAAVGGLWFWSPRIGGSLLPAGHGRLGVLALVFGAVLLGAADVVAGFFGAGDAMLEAPANATIDAMVVLSVVGAAILALGVLGVVAAMAVAVRSPNPAANPWNGHTLEWATESLTASGDFAEPRAPVVSEAPLLDRVEGHNRNGGGSGAGRSGPEVG